MAAKAKTAMMMIDRLNRVSWILSVSLGQLSESLLCLRCDFSSLEAV